MTAPGWFHYARMGGGDGDTPFVLQGDQMLVHKPGPGDVVVAVCAEDGVKASVVISRERLAENGIAPYLAGLEMTQAEVRAKRDVA